METAEIEATVFRILQKIAQCDQPVGRDSRLREDLGLDSFASLMVMNELDDAFAITIVDDEFKGVELASDVVKLLKERYLVPARTGEGVATP